MPPAGSPAPGPARSLMVIGYSFAEARTARPLGASGWPSALSSPRSPVSSPLCSGWAERVEASGCAGQVPANSESVSSAPPVDVLGSQGEFSPGLRPSTSQNPHVRRRRALPYGCALHPYDVKPTGTRVRRDLPVVLNELLFPHQPEE